MPGSRVDTFCSNLIEQDHRNGFAIFFTTAGFYGGNDVTAMEKGRKSDF